MREFNETTVKIQRTLREGIREGARREGPFLVRIDDESDHPFRNYAIPDDFAVPTQAEISALVAHFRAIERKPRLEYVRPSPAVDDALATAGFSVDVILPLMALVGVVIEPVACGIVVSAVEDENELRAAAVVQNIAYGQGDSASEADVARLRSTAERGGMVMCAHRDGAVVGAGLFTAPHRGFAEVAAVGVLPEFRRRGVALALTAQLSSAALSLGARPFLQTESMNEQRLYGRIGYSRVGELAAVSLAERQP